MTRDIRTYIDRTTFPIKYAAKQRAKLYSALLRNFETQGIEPLLNSNEEKTLALLFCATDEGVVNPNEGIGRGMWVEILKYYNKIRDKYKITEIEGELYNHNIKNKDLYFAFVDIPADAFGVAAFLLTLGAVYACDASANMRSRVFHRKIVNLFSEAYK